MPGSTRTVAAGRASSRQHRRDGERGSAAQPVVL